MSSGGYPGPYDNGKVIKGLTKASECRGVEVFHAGTVRKQGRVVTNGGRVLGITAVGNTLKDAIAKAYSAVDEINWTNCYCRRDIGEKALRRSSIASQQPEVGIVMGSDSDLPAMKAAVDFLKSMGIGCEMSVASAHRTPEKAVEYAKNAQQRGLKVIIAGAGMAAHLAGVLASQTDLPVIGVPLNASSLGGLDALLSTVQMPPGIPVATMGIGKAGAKNGAILAMKILALQNPELGKKLVKMRHDMIREVEEKSRKINA
jgi:phosphoribosylamine--glycine ligase